MVNPTHVAKMLPIGKPIPSFVCAPTPAFFSGSSFNLFSSSHRANCSSTVARSPSGRELKLRNAPIRTRSVRVAFWTCEKDNKSFGEATLSPSSPPPIKP